MNDELDEQSENVVDVTWKSGGRETFRIVGRTRLGRYTVLYGRVVTREHPGGGKLTLIPFPMIQQIEASSVPLGEADDRSEVEEVVRPSPPWPREVLEYCAPASQLYGSMVLGEEEDDVK